MFVLPLLSYAKIAVKFTRTGKRSKLTRAGRSAFRRTSRDCQPKPDAPIVVVLRNLVALRHCAVNRPIVKAPTPKNSFGSWANQSRTIHGDAADVSSEDVLAPFPDISGHVIDTELVGRLHANWLRVIAVLAIVPGHGVNVVTSAEPKTVRPEGTTPSRVLPLSF